MATYEKYAHGTPNWIDLMAKDAEAAAQWYGKMFGWEAEQQASPGGAPYWMFRKDGHNVAGLGQMSPEMMAGGVPPVWNSYFAVDDVDAAIAKATELGGSVMFPAMDIPNAGRMAFLADPEGGVFALWQDQGHCGSTLVNEPNTWCWSEHDAKDLGTASKFYANLFGWTIGEGMNGSVMYSIGENAIAHGLQIAPEWGPVPPHWAVYICVENVDEACGRVQASGGSVMVPGTDIPVGRFALVTDPQGARFYLFQMAEAA